MSKIFQTQFHQWKLKDKVSWDLMVSNGAEFKQTWKGLAMGFDGDTNYIDGGTVTTSNPLQLNWPHSITVIFNAKLTWDPAQRLVEKANGSNWQNGWAMIVDSNWKMNYSVNGNISRTQNYDIKANIDNVVTLVNDWTGVRSMYINSRKARFTSWTWTLPPSVETWLKIGSWHSLSAREFNGNIYNIIIHDHVLSQAEINNLYKEFLARSPLAVQTRDFYYPKPTESNEDGLVASYNMIPSENNILVDTSGNGNNWTISWPLATLDGMQFDGVDDYVDTTVITTWTISMLLTWRFIDAGHISSAQNNSTTSLTNVTDNEISIRDDAGSWPDIVWTQSIAYTSIAGKTGTFVARIWPTTVDVHFNGVLIASEAYALSNPVELNIPFYISCKDRGGTAEIFSNHEIYDYRIYNKSISDQEIQDYHNNRASQAYLYEDFRYALADGTTQLPLGWDVGTGSFKIAENAGLDGNSKALECTSNGTIAKQSSQAYGTWEFEIYKEASANNNLVHFISSSTSGGERYTLYFSASTDKVVLLKDVTPLMNSASDYININTTYWIKVTRTTAWIFTMYIKGWAYGSSYTLVDVSGGFWTNPVTDNTYTTSNFSVLDLDAGDQIANIKYSKWVVV